MNKSDLKDGMVVTIRGGQQCILIERNLFKNNFTLNSTLFDYNEDLTHKKNKNNDIVKVFGIGKLKELWEREEVDWSKVPAGTKVLVSDINEREYAGYFIEYKANNEFYKFHVLIKKGDFYESCYLGNCKLTEKPKEVISYGQMIKELDEICDKHYEESETCHGCEYFSDDGMCNEDKLVDNNFTITRK